MDVQSSKTSVNDKLQKGGWEKVNQRVGSLPPCHRSLHAAASWKDNIIIFGGYDGHQRLNDLHTFNFTNLINDNLLFGRTIT
jgi:hypothetical protein